MYALLPTKIHNFLLWQQWVIFYLVDCGRDGCARQEFGEVLHAVVCDADGLDFIGVLLDEGFEVLPGLDVAGGVVDVAGAGGEFGEEGVVSCTRKR
jgi:hypothetical protein